MNHMQKEIQLISKAATTIGQIITAASQFYMITPLVFAFQGKRNYTEDDVYFQIEYFIYAELKKYTLLSWEYYTPVYGSEMTISHLISITGSRRYITNT